MKELLMVISIFPRGTKEEKQCKRVIPGLTEDILKENPEAVKAVAQNTISVIINEYLVNNK